MADGWSVPSFFLLLVSLWFPLPLCVLCVSAVKSGPTIASIPYVIQN
jgi:hypothetical protein